MLLKKASCSSGVYKLIQFLRISFYWQFYSESAGCIFQPWTLCALYINTDNILLCRFIHVFPARNADIFPKAVSKVLCAHKKWLKKTYSVSWAICQYCILTALHIFSALFLSTCSDFLQTCPALIPDSCFSCTVHSALQCTISLITIQHYWSFF